VLRGDITCVPIRGNAGTRLAKVRDGELDAVVLAYAGLARIGHTDLASEIFEPDSMVPSPGQGALAVECRAEDAELTGLLATIDHQQSRAAVTAERGLLAALEAGCSAPVGAYAAFSGTRLRLDAVVLGEKMIVREHGEADATDAARLGRELAARMLALGAADLVGGNTDRNDTHD
jgi:hydroxymethylbilane synthase